MNQGVRTVYHSNAHQTLVLEEQGSKVVYYLDKPPSVKSLFTRLGFPEGNITAGLSLSEEMTGPRLLLHRVYVQKMPGQHQPGQLIWCCVVLPDRDAQPPEVLTPPEAERKFGLKPSR